MMAASMSRLIRAAPGDVGGGVGGGSMTGSNNAGEVQPGTDGQKTDRQNKRGKASNLKPPSRLCSGLDQFHITGAHFDQQKRARLRGARLQPCHHVSQQATAPSAAQGLRLIRGAFNPSGLAVNYWQSQGG